MIHFFVRFRFCFSYFAAEDTSSWIRLFLGTLDNCMQRHEDTVFRTPNMLGNVAKRTLNDSAVQGGGSQGQFFHLVPKRAKFIPSVTPNSSGFVSSLLSATYVHSVASSVVLASVFCRRGPLICTNVGGGAWYPALFPPSAGQPNLEKWAEVLSNQKIDERGVMNKWGVV